MVKEKPAATPPMPRRAKGRFANRLAMLVAVILGAVFLPVTVVLLAGMLPSIVALFVDNTREKTRALTVTLLNFVACFPFVMDVAFRPQNMQTAYEVLADPTNIVIMYAGAVVGYFFDWTMAGISNVVMTTRAHTRLESIDKRQAELKRRFGVEVTGEIPLDVDGFPLHQSEDKA